MGTLAYIAPELIQSDKDSSTPAFQTLSDMWSLGVIVYLLLSGRFPFQAHDQQKLINLILSCDYDFEPPEAWRTISKDCKNFIEKLLEPNLSTRLTPAEALKHKWFSGPDQGCNWAVSDQVVKALKSYRRTNDLAFICDRIVASCFVDPESQLDVKESFLAINTSDSGEVTVHELAFALPALSQSEIEGIISNCCQESGREAVKWSEF